MSKLNKNEARTKVWQELRKVAYPDSKFHWDFNEYIPDYEGSHMCAERLAQLDVYRDQEALIFITPDNNLNIVREYCIKDGKDFIMPTYGIKRGFFYLDPKRVPVGQEAFASTLDGMERFARPITLNEIKEMGRKVNPLITGASVITLSGIRCGKGHGYFDLEWAMLRMKGLVDESTPIYAVAHDCQVVKDLELEPTEFDSIVDGIITPTKLIEVKSNLSKPKGVVWEKLQAGMLETIPPLRVLYEETH